MRFLIVCGTRPEILKLSPIVWELKRREQEFRVVYTGQHRDKEMSDVFFDEVMEHRPDAYIRAGTEGFGPLLRQTEDLIGAYIESWKPHAVIVQGDTVSALAGCFAAESGAIPVAHVEAGLRSFDLTMPEEICRVIIDHRAAWCFAPIEESAENLHKEHVPGEVHICGNTFVEALQKVILGSVNVPVPGEKFFLMTMHRPENVDDAARANRILAFLRCIRKNFEDFEIVFPAHPRTRKRWSNEFFKLVRAEDPVP